MLSLCARRAALSREACSSPAAQCGHGGECCMDVCGANQEAHSAAGPLLSPIELQLIYNEADTVSATSSTRVYSSQLIPKPEGGVSCMFPLSPHTG